MYFFFDRGLVWGQFSTDMVEIRMRAGIYDTNGVLNFLWVLVGYEERGVGGTNGFRRGCILPVFGGCYTLHAGV